MFWVLTGHPACGFLAKSAWQNHAQPWSLLLAFQKYGCLSFWGTWLCFFWCNILVKCFWNILEQINWKNYVKTIPDKVSADYLNFMLSYKQWDWALCFQHKAVLLDSNTWCAWMLLISCPCCWLSWVQVLSCEFRHTGELLGLTESSSKALSWVSEHEWEQASFYASLPQETPFSPWQGSPLLLVNSNLSFYPYNHNHILGTWNHSFVVI